MTDNHCGMRAPRIGLAALLVLFVVTCSATSDASRDTGAANDQEEARLVGAWRFVRQEGRNVRSGEVVADSTAEDLPGMLIYSADGWMSVSIDRRPKGGSYWGYFGKFSIENEKLVHTIEGGSIAARGPSPANYRFENDARQLVISTLPGSNDVVVHYTFERLR